MTHLRSLAVWAFPTAAVFVGLSRVALLWRGDLSPSPLWVATAACTALAIAAPPRHMPGVVLGVVAGGVISGVWIFDDSVRQLLSPVLAKTVEVVVAALLVRSFLPAGPSIRRTRDAVRLVGIVMVAVTASATVAIADTASAVIDVRLASWGRWVLGDAVGQLLILPVVLTRRARLITTATPFARTELVASCVVLGAVTAVACSVTWPLIYVTAPLTLWLAIRFGPRVAAPAALMLAVVVTIVSGRGAGPFVALDEPVEQAQLFNLVLAVSSLIGGAHALRAWGDHQRLVAVVASLPDIVLVRNDDGEVLDAWVPPGHDDDIVAVVPSVTAGIPIIDGPVPATVDPALITAPSGTTYERRRAEIEPGKVLELYRDVTDEQRANKLLRQRDEAVEEARRSEQARIVSEIHDSPLQLIIAARMRLEAMTASARSELEPNASNTVAAITDLLSQATSELRGQISALTPSLAESGDVVAALLEHARRMFGADVDVRGISTVRHPPDLPTAKLLFQAGREGLANVVKHASATTVTVGLDEDESGYCLVVADNGIGVAPGSARGVGLPLMLDRVTEHGGRVELRSDFSGAQLVVWIPR